MCQGSGVRCGKAAAGDPATGARALVIAGTDQHLSGWEVPVDSAFRKRCCAFKRKRGAVWKKLMCFCQGGVKATPALVKSLVDSSFFASVAYESMDTGFDGVRPAPIPFTTGYSLAMDGAVARNLVEVARASSLEGKEGILAAWGTAWPMLDNIVESRASAIKWLTDNPLVNRTSVSRDQFHTVLSQKKFILSPTGGGIQSPKNWEAFLVNTIPIVQREPAYVGLAQLGFPLALVEEWEEVTQERMDRWWIELSPKLEQAKWMFLKEIWWAFVTHPCPITSVAEFLDEIKR